MARTTHFIGLKQEAVDYLRGAECILTYVGTTGMFDEQINFCAFNANERIYFEIIQAEPWSSGPVIFTCLIDSHGRKHFEWTEEEMNIYL